MSKIRYWLPAILYMALIFYFSSRTPSGMFHIFPIIFGLKTSHMVEFGILYSFYYYALRKTTSYDVIEAFSVAFMLTLIYGLTDEFHQIFVIGRTSRLIDAVANVAGALIAEIFTIRYNSRLYDKH